MANKDDITSVVTGIVKKFITPKYPIYRISYILSILRFDCLETEYRTHLVELTDTLQIFDKETTPTITKKFIAWWNGVKAQGKKVITVEDIDPRDIDSNMCEDHCSVIATIISIDRVA